MQPRNLFVTKTMQGVFGMVVAFAIATAPLAKELSPAVNQYVDRKLDPKAAEDVKFYLAFAVMVGGFLRATYGRHQATGNVFTPELLPGRGKADVIN